MGSMDREPRSEIGGALIKLTLQNFVQVIIVVLALGIMYQSLKSTIETNSAETRQLKEIVDRQSDWLVQIGTKVGVPPPPRSYP